MRKCDEFKCRELSGPCQAPRWLLVGQCVLGQGLEWAGVGVTARPGQATMHPTGFSVPWCLFLSKPQCLSVLVSARCLYLLDRHGEHAIALVVDVLACGGLVPCLLAAGSWHLHCMLMPAACVHAGAVRQHAHARGSHAPTDQVDAPCSRRQGGRVLMSVTAIRARLKGSAAHKHTASPPGARANSSGAAPKALVKASVSWA